MLGNHNSASVAEGETIVIMHSKFLSKTIISLSLEYFGGNGRAYIMLIILFTFRKLTGEIKLVHYHFLLNFVVARHITITIITKNCSHILQRG